MRPMERTIQLGKIQTSRNELVDITKAWFTISLAFALVYAQMDLLGGSFSFSKLFSLDFLQLFGVALVTAGLGFLLHELSHKFVAQRYGCAAEFRSFDQMLYLALGLAVVTGFIFAAPGAVMISGMVTRKENGLISLAGPLMNYILAAIFFGLTLFFPTWAPLLLIGFSINMWLGLFNMLPFWNFDGKKIFYWNKAVWGAMVAVGVYTIFF